MGKVSVIIPVYNASSTLEKCLNSVINQTYKNLEILCIDDASKDDSIKVIKKYMKKDPRIKLLTNKVNSGPGVTKGRGVKHATGDYISFVDSDDYIELNMVEQLVNFSNKNELDVVRCSYNNCIEGKLYARKMEFDTMVLDSVSKEKFIKGLLDGSIPAYMQLLLIRKKFLDSIDVKLGEQYFLEDLLFYLKLFVKTDKIGVINECLCNYVINPSGITFSLDFEKINRRIVDILYYNKAAKDMFNTMVNIIDARTSYLLIHSFYELYSSKNNKDVIVDYINKEDVRLIFNNSYIVEDRFTKKALKLIKQRKYKSLFLWFDLAKVYIGLKRKLLK